MAHTPRLPRAERRAQLIEAAAGAFLERGFDGTSMDDVAQAAGVSRLIVYRIFETKQELYRVVLTEVLIALGDRFEGLGIEDIQERGASELMLPVARAHPDAFRLLWRHAWHEPDFEDLSTEFRTYVIFYAREILRSFIEDELILEWAARSAGAHLVDGLCNWLDDGDASRDQEFGVMMTRGIRALAGSWVESARR